MGVEIKALVMTRLTDLKKWLWEVEVIDDPELHHIIAALEPCIVLSAEEARLVRRVVVLDVKIGEWRKTYDEALFLLTTKETP